MSALIGEIASEFNLPDTDARMRWLSEFHRLGPAVLIFMPSVYGLRPRWQLWSLLRHYDHFVEQTTEIVVVAADPLPELRIFQIQRGFPFVFLCDQGGAVGKVYDIPSGGAGAMVLTTGGVIRYSQITYAGPRSSGPRLLRSLHTLTAEERAPRRVSSL
jgi:peroxiredoxin